MKPYININVVKDIQKTIFHMPYIYDVNNKENSLEDVLQLLNPKKNKIAIFAKKIDTVKAIELRLKNIR